MGIRDGIMNRVNQLGEANITDCALEVQTTARTLEREGKVRVIDLPNGTRKVVAAGK